MAASDRMSPQELAQKDYDDRVTMLKALQGDDPYAFEIAAHDYLGHNSLQLLTNMHGNYEAGWIDDIEFNQVTRDRLLAFNRQDIASTYAITKSILRISLELQRKSSRITWLLAGNILLSLVLISEIVH